MKSLDEWASDIAAEASDEFYGLEDELDIANDIEFLFGLDLVRDAQRGYDYYEG